MSVRECVCVRARVRVCARACVRVVHVLGWPSRSLSKYVGIVKRASRSQSEGAHFATAVSQTQSSLFGD